jgi:hypothetical protein
MPQLLLKAVSAHEVDLTWAVMVNGMPLIHWLMRFHKLVHAKV